MSDSLIARDVEEVGRVERDTMPRELEHTSGESNDAAMCVVREEHAREIEGMGRRARRTIDPALIDRIFAAIKGYVDRRVKSADALPDSSRVDKLEQKLSAITKDLAALRRDLGRGG